MIFRYPAACNVETQQTSTRPISKSFHDGLFYTPNCPIRDLSHRIYHIMTSRKTVEYNSQSISGPQVGSETKTNHLDHNPNEIPINLSGLLTNPKSLPLKLKSPASRMGLPWDLVLGDPADRGLQGVRNGQGNPDCFTGSPKGYSISSDSYWNIIKRKVDPDCSTKGFLLFLGAVVSVLWNDLLFSQPKLLDAVWTVQGFHVVACCSHTCGYVYMCSNSTYLQEIYQ